MLTKAMIDGWQKRLVKAIDAHQARTNESDSALSKEAGLGLNFIGQLRKERSSPKLDALEKLANYVGASLIEILFERDLSKDEWEFVRTFRQIESGTQRAAFSQILHGMTQTKGSLERAADPQEIKRETDEAPQ